MATLFCVRLPHRFNLAYVHLVEPRVAGITDNPDTTDSIEPFRKVGSRGRPEGAGLDGAGPEGACQAGQARQGRAGQIEQVKPGMTDRADQMVVSGKDGTQHCTQMVLPRPPACLHACTPARLPAHAC